MTYKSIANPDSSLLKFDPDRGIHFNQTGLLRDLADVTGHFIDIKVLKSSLEEQWRDFIADRCPEVWFQKTGTDEWERQTPGFCYPKQLLKNRRSFGLLFATPFKQLTTPVFVFIEVRENPKHYWRSSFPFAANFSIRDAHANHLEPLGTIIGEAEGVTRSKRFRFLVRELRYFDGTPIVEDPDLLLSSLNRIADEFDERDLAQSLQTSFEEIDNGDEFICYTDLQTKRELLPLSMPIHRIAKDAPISLLFMKGFKVHVLFGDDVENAVPLSIFYPAIDRFLNRKSTGLRSAGFNLQSLAAITERRNWDFKNEKIGEMIPLGSLEKYLELTFERIDEDIHEAEKQQDGCQELVSTPDGKGVLFCTGLTHRDFGSYIYACCSDPDDNGVYQTVRWVFGIGPEGNRDYPPELCFPRCDGQRNHGLPYPANWTREPEKLVFQYQRGAKSNIHFDFDHMYNEHIDRIKFDGADTTGIGDDLTREELEERITTAWSTTRKLLEANYKNAIPTYYQGDIQLLVPLFLDKRKPSTPSAALVLARDRTGNRYYYAPTFLTLEMARNNALVITRIDDSWLTPDPIPGTISWLQGQWADEIDEGKKEKVRKAIADLTALL